MNERGFSLLEIIIAAALFAVFSSFAVYQLSALDDPLQNGVNQTIGLLKQARAKAIANTAAYRVFPASSGQLTAETAVNCSSDDTQEDGFLTMDLPGGVAFDSTDWDVCFSSRGLPDGNLVLALSGHGGTEAIEVYLGGAVRQVE